MEKPDKLLTKEELANLEEGLRKEPLPLNCPHCRGTLYFGAASFAGCCSYNFYSVVYCPNCGAVYAEYEDEG